MNNSKNYINIYVKIYEEFYEMLGSFLNEYPVVGIEEKLDEVMICFEEKDVTPELMQDIESIVRQISPEARILKKEKLADRNWNEEWEKGVTPIIIDDEIAITPDWHAESLKQKHKILINPKMSFGTGHHATTRLMTRLMKDLIKKDSFWIDAGSGTGVLAILAVKFGAGNVFAFDNNEWAVENSIENIEMNGCIDKIKMTREDIFEMELPECDGIAANMYTHILTRTFPKFHKALVKTNGDLVVSGVLVYDKEELLNSADDAGFEHIETIQEDEWIAVHFKPGKK